MNVRKIMSVTVRPRLRSIVSGSILFLGLWFGQTAIAVAAVSIPYPVVFVTQVPMPSDFTTIGAVFGNHKATMQDVPRGGDLWIRYEDGSLKNLTLAAGVSGTGLMGANSIAVRDPSPSWDGKSVVFSMVIGAPTQQYQVQPYFWQLYEITGLGRQETPTITKVANQPATFNNISPIYGTDARIIFTSDRPRTGEAHLYPQLDEYEEAPTVSGLWSLNPTTGDLFMVNHSPSGAFTPSIDSFGRVIFTRWDHLQRDQQADADAEGSGNYGTFNYSDETANALKFNVRSEVYPESRTGTATLSGHVFNQFFPWQINEDGTEEETINHVGRQELANYGSQSFLDDSNLTYCCYTDSRYNKFKLNNDSMLQIKEDPSAPGMYFGTSAPEFGTHAAGQIIKLSGSPNVNADAMTVTYVTHPATAAAVDESSAPGAGNTGLYREPLPLSDGALIAVHTNETRADRNTGSTASPSSRYSFRLKLLVFDAASGYYVAGEPLTTGISKNLAWYDPDTLVSYSGDLWELNPVELKARTKPPTRVTNLPTPESQVFSEEGVDVQRFKTYLKDNNLALVVSRNVTQRDAADLQQPFNLRVAGGATSIAKPGKVYDVSHMQFFQADQLRGIGGTTNPRAGRRVLPQVMHSDQGRNPVLSVPGATAIAPDGSVAAFVPARRAMSWQLTNNADPVVRERYWLTMQPGEVRVCASCHGVNQKSQTDAAEPQNKPEALRQVLRTWKANPTRLLNIATRGKVETVDNVMIAGFIIQGSSAKKVLIRARGPSLAAAPFNVPGTLADPFLTLYSGATPIDTNDDFAQHANAAQIPADWTPASAKEAAIVTTLSPGAYTAIVNGVSSTSGVAIVEVFELDQPGTPLINIATRGPVQTGDNVMIAGLIIQGDAPQTVLITARGPSMAGPPHNVPGTLSDPVLTLFSGQTPIASNDNWPQAANAAQIQTAIGAPTNTLESAILITLQPGAYTAIVNGASNATGLGIVEVFAQ
jgi:hypothetical protein